MASCERPAGRPPVAPCRWPRRGAGRAGLGHRRLDPHPGCVARIGRLQEHAAPHAAGRHRAAVDHARHRVRDHARRDRRGADARNPGAAPCGAGQAPARRLAAGRAAHAAARRARRHGGCVRSSARCRRCARKGRASKTSCCPNSPKWRRSTPRGGFAAAESWAWHRKRLAERSAGYDPRVAMRIRRGETMGAADYVDLLQARAHWIARMDEAMRGIDAMLSPTVPIVAPEIAPLLASDDAFFAANGALLRNPSMVNLLDGCALSLPCHRAGRVPGGPDGVERRAGRRPRAEHRPGHRSGAASGARPTDARRRHRRRHRGRHHRLRTRVRWTRGHRVRAPGERGRRNQLRQRRRGGAGLCHAVGRTGHAGQGAQATVRQPRGRPPGSTVFARAAAAGCGAGGAPAVPAFTRPTAAAWSGSRATAWSACTR